MYYSFSASFSCNSMPHSVCSALREPQLRKVILIMRKLYFRTIYGRGRIMILVFFFTEPHCFWLIIVTFLCIVIHIQKFLFQSPILGFVILQNEKRTRQNCNTTDLIRIKTFLLNTNIVCII